MVSRLVNICLSYVLCTVGMFAIISHVAAEPMKFAQAPTLPDGRSPEFNGYDVMDLIERQQIATDCKINTNVGAKLYCFATDASKEVFLQSPKDNIMKATDMFAAADIDDTGKAMEKFESGDVEIFIDSFIKAAAAETGGIYVLDDPVTASSIPLVYDKIDFTRTLKGYGFFPAVNFHVRYDPKKRYLVDFGVVPKDGKLAVLGVRIYKTLSRTEKLGDGAAPTKALVVDSGS